MTVFAKGKKGLFSFEFEFHGQRHRKPCKTTNRQIAERMEREYRRKLELGQYDLVDLNKKKIQLFKHMVKEFIALSTASWKPKTLAMHNTSLPKVTAYFGDMLLCDITSADLEMYRTVRQGQISKLTKQPPSNRTINTEIILVRQLLDYHDLWHRIAKTRKFKMLKENKRKGKRLNQEQVRQLLIACRESNSRALYPAVMLSIFTGLRSSELKGLRWNQIDLDNATLVVGESKTVAGEGRIVQLSASALDLIKNWKSNFLALPNHYVFPSERYAGMKGRIGTFPERPYTTFWTSWDRARCSVGIDARWHDLRHSCASIIGSGGASRATLRAMFGWSKDAMTDVYDHSLEQEQKLAVQSLDTFFADILNQEPVKEIVQ